MKTLIIYHGGCPDGFTAAWAARKSLGREYEAYAAGYNQDPPDVTDRNVLIVDFSYPRETLLRMYESARSLRVYDHHKTAEVDLKGLSFCTFDMERSGAGIAWDELVGGPRPWLVDYVEDRDLWRWKLSDSCTVNNYVMATPYTMQHWDELEGLDVSEVIAGGLAIQRKIDAYCSAMDFNTREVEWEGREFLVVNAPQVMISDLLHHLCNRTREEKGLKDVMAMGWWQRSDGKYQHSLRSIGGIDVSVLAKKFGGGGHTHAAGFVVDKGPVV